MENFRPCPICTEVPEREIYQCSEGHIICHLCISKVSGGRCPQCRVLFGIKRIRSRVLEEILDSQDFECKFKYKGCTRLVKRGEITSRVNSCSFNPATVALCQELSLSCGFRLGCVSRAEVIAHFETRHKSGLLHFPTGTWFRFNYGNNVMTHFTRKRKAGPVSKAHVVFGKLGCLDKNSDTSPLFLMMMLVNQPVGFLSAVCVKVWESEFSPTNHIAKIRLIKASQPEPASSSSAVNVVNPFPISGSMKVASLQEACQVVKARPVNIPLSLLEASRFGATMENYIEVKISRIP